MISVLIPTFNEASNILDCLRSVAWADEIVVVDSRSVDDTRSLASGFGARVVDFAWNGRWPKKKNWALENIAWRNEWLLILDADERITPALTREIQAVTRASPLDGYFLNRRFLFMGRWLRHCGYYPSWNLRLFRHAAGRYETLVTTGTSSGDNEIHEHLIVSGRTGYLQHDMLHLAYPDIFTWVEKHNRYSNWEAHVELSGERSKHESSFAVPGWKRRVKLWSRLAPFRPALRFFYHYVLRRGLLDGYEGYVFCRLLGMYELLTVLKNRELRGPGNWQGPCVSEARRHPIRLRPRAAAVNQMHDWLRMIWWFCPVGLLWCALVRHLSIEWRLNPQYTYAWAVPVLCLWVAWAEFRRLGTEGHEPARPARRSGWRLGAIVLLGIAYIPTRVIEEANPDWRLVSWVFAAEVIALTLLLGSVALSVQTSPAPVLLFFTAVPWPTCVERPLIQGLSTSITLCASTILDLAGLPCLSHGNVIEVGAGRVGIEEACSGIRSLQASCMLALVFGVLYRLPKRRLLLCLSSAVAFSFFTNLLRTIWLTTLAARCGIDSMLRWHELTGTVTALVCFIGVWLFAAWLRNQRGSGNLPAIRTGPSYRLIPIATLNKPLGVSMKVATVLVALVAGAELANSAWYGFRERDLPPAVTWRIKPPREQEQLRELGMSDEVRRLLRYDEGVNLGWTDDDGLSWQAIFLRWNPGGAAGRLARNHTPGDCLAAAGAQPLAEGGQQVRSVQGLQLPIRTYVARTERGLARVYYCLWEDRSPSRSFAPAYSTYAARLAAVRAGVRNSGQRSLELAVWNAVSEKESEEAVQRVLTTIIETDR